MGYLNILKGDWCGCSALGGIGPEKVGIFGVRGLLLGYSPVMDK